MAKPTKQVREAVEGGHANPESRNPFLWSSSLWEAWEFGRFMGRAGRSIEGLDKGRGLLWRTLGGYAFKGEYPKETPARIVWERIA